MNHRQSRSCETSEREGGVRGKVESWWEVSSGERARPRPTLGPQLDLLTNLGLGYFLEEFENAKGFERLGHG